MGWLVLCSFSIGKNFPFSGYIPMATAAAESTIAVPRKQSVCGETNMIRTQSGVSHSFEKKGNSAASCDVDEC